MSSNINIVGAQADAKSEFMRWNERENYNGFAKALSEEIGNAALREFQVLLRSSTAIPGIYHKEVSFAPNSSALARWIISSSNGNLRVEPFLEWAKELTGEYADEAARLLRKNEFIERLKRVQELVLPKLNNQFSAVFKKSENAHYRFSIFSQESMLHIRIVPIITESAGYEAF